MPAHRRSLMHWMALPMQSVARADALATDSMLTERLEALGEFDEDGSWSPMTWELPLPDAASGRSVRVPVISLMPLGGLGVTDAEVSFAFEPETVRRTSDDSGSTRSSLAGRLATPPERRRPQRRAPVMTFRLRAKSVGVPEGVQRLQEKTGGAIGLE